MRPCFHIEIETPKKILLNGLWFGPKKAKRVIVWVHGLGSSAFSRLNIVDQLVDGTTAVMTFNNRGHDKIATINNTKGKRLLGGAAHEVFTESADDIEGAIRSAKGTGAKEIFLAGHSTGCQKSVYWASTKGRGVKGLILLAPLSDYTALRLEANPREIARALQIARRMTHSGQKHALLPQHWAGKWLTDAQRFLSLYSGEGAEETFTYWDATRRPRALRSIKLPILALLAGADEYADRPAEEIAAWFLAHIYEGEVGVIPAVSHGFSGGEKQVARAIAQFIEDVV